MLGTVVDSKYQILNCLGQGGMGTVYEARHLGMGRRVALKMIIPEALATRGDVIPRFQREARASGVIDSEHVVQVLDTGVDPFTSRPYLVMEYLTGEDLQQVLRRVGPLPPDVVLRIIAQACAGLTSAHELGIIHRDIKSANLFVSRRETGEVTIKILDFGIAKVRADPMSSTGNQGITSTGAMLGSPLYMSPEHVLGSKDIDARSDVFSLGVTMYEALCGATPHHDCETVGLLIIAITSGRMAHVQDHAPWVSAEVAAIVHQALAFDPSARYQTAAEMQAAITALLQHGATLHDSMLASVAPETLRAVAPKLVQMTTPLGPPVPRAPASVAAETPFTDSSSPVIPTRPLWHVALPFALVALLVAGIGIYTLSKRAILDNPPAALVTSPPSATAGASAVPIPSAAASLATVITDKEVDAPAIHSASSPSAGAPTTSVSAGALRPRPALPSAPPAARPNCDLPYTFNADGKKIWKRECL